MTLEEFTQKEGSILDGIRKKGLDARTTGLKCTLPETGSSAGYLIALRYSDADMKEIDEISHRIRDSVDGKAIIYGLCNGHQTIADYGIKNVEGEFVPDEEVLEKLAKGTKAAFEMLTKKDVPINAFGNFVPSSDSVILMPLMFSSSSESAYNLIQNVVGEVSKLGVNPRGTWGEHMTISRFTQAIPPQEMEEFNNLMWDGNNPRLDHTRLDAYSGPEDVRWVSPKRIDVGYLVMNKTGFQFNPVESFEF